MRIARLLAAVAVLVVALTLVRFVVLWADEAYLGNASGIWAALATDFSDGSFYRPVLSPDGYGGTRYFPLHFVLHGTLIRAVGHPVATGQLMAAVGGILLAFGVHAVLRRLGAAPMVAAAASALVFASQAVQAGLLQIRPDTLSAALNLWGLAVCLRPTLTGRRAAWAAGLFVLAFAAKPTAVAGAAAAVGWLMLAGRRRDARRVGIGAAVGWTVVVALVHWGSDGWGTYVIRTGGLSDVTVTNLLRAPLVFARVAREVPESLVFIQLGLAAWLVNALEGRLRSAPSLWLAATVAATVLIYVFEGADINHLTALQAASVVMVIAVALEEDRLRALALGTLAIGGLAASLSLATGLADLHAAARATLADAVALVPADDRPVLAENPLVAIARGDRPYLLNAYMFRLVRDRDPAFAEPLWQALAGQRFAAVVLERDPASERGRDWYAGGYFGSGFVDRVEQSYERAATSGSRVIYLPR